MEPIPARPAGLLVQRKCAACESGGKPCPKCEDEEESIQRKPLSKAPTPLLQRQPNDSKSAEAEPAAKTAPARERSTRHLIVDDEAVKLAPGQMRKSEFLEQLQSEVCSVADEAMAETGQSTEGCPYLASWFEFYRGKDSQHLERSLHRFAPETAGVTTAGQYIPIIAARVRRSVATWARTGEITGVPEELRAAMLGGSILSALGSIASKIGGAVSSLVGSIGRGLSAIGRGISAVGSMLFKGRDGGPSAGGDPVAIQAQLGAGRSLDGGVSSRIGSAFGQDFSHVRIHTDATASRLTDEYNARAFTVGEHVAFGAGEYQPGTLIGDALIAHELAHVVQQKMSKASNVPLQKGEVGDRALEEDADNAALGAVVSLWSGAKGRLANLARNASPSLKSGLRLSRCKTECPTKIEMTRLNRITLNHHNYFARGIRTGMGAVAEMRVSDPTNRNWEGSLIREKLDPGSSTCQDMANCTNLLGRSGGEEAKFAEGEGSIFTVGQPLPKNALDITAPARRNTFYDLHIFAWPTSELHQRNLESCKQNCEQRFECVGGGPFPGVFQLTRNFTRDRIRGANVTNVEVFKLQWFGTDTNRR
jgi:hypothetical protein